MASANHDRFSNLAGDYAAHRPGYPAAAIDWVIGKATLDASTLVADVGAGTGISSRLFAERGIPVLGIEPNEPMRAEAERHPWPFAAPPPTYRAGSAEATGVADEAVRAVVVAQAFHWFDPAKALLEFERILQPGGWVFVLNYERDETDGFSRACSELVRTVPGAAEVERQRQSAADFLLTWDRLMLPERRVFASEQLLDEEGFLGRLRSISYLPRQEPQRGELFAQARILFHRWQQKGRVVMVYATTVTAAQKPA